MRIDASIMYSVCVAVPILVLMQSINRSRSRIAQIDRLVDGDAVPDQLVAAQPRMST